jgi:hypothetical protein
LEIRWTVFHSGSWNILLLEESEMDRSSILSRMQKRLGPVFIP